MGEAGGLFQGYCLTLGRCWGQRLARCQPDRGRLTVAAGCFQGGSLSAQAPTMAWACLPLPCLG